MPAIDKPDSPLTTTVKWRFPAVHPEGRKFLVVAGAAVLFSDDDAVLSAESLRRMVTYQALAARAVWFVQRDVLRLPAGVRRGAARFVQRVQEGVRQERVGAVLAGRQGVPCRLADLGQGGSDMRAIIQNIVPSAT